MLPGERWCYLMARVLLQQGRSDRALMFIGELMQTCTGRPHARRLLAEIHGSTAAPLANAHDPERAPAAAHAAGIHRKT